MITFLLVAILIIMFCLVCLWCPEIFIGLILVAYCALAVVLFIAPFLGLYVAFC